MKCRNNNNKKNIDTQVEALIADGSTKSQEELAVVKAMQALFVNLTGETDEEVSAEGRELAKDPLLLIIYGSGIPSILQAQEDRGVDYFYESLENLYAELIAADKSKNKTALKIAIIAKRK